MMNGIMEHLQSNYLVPLQVVWPALVAALALAVAGGVVGVFVVLRREALVVLAMPQIVMLGAALGMRYDWPELPPAIGTVAAALGLIGWFRHRDRGDLILPALYVAGLCIAILVVSNAGAHLTEVQSLFSGVDVAVGAEEAVIAAGASWRRRRSARCCGGDGYCWHRPQRRRSWQVCVLPGGTRCSWSC